MIYREDEGNTNTQGNLNEEATANANTQQQHEAAAEEQLNNANQGTWGNQTAGNTGQTTDEYVNGGFNQQSFQQAFKTNEGSSAEQVLGAVTDMFSKPISTGHLNERTTKLVELFKDYYRQANEAHPGSIKVDFIQAPGSKISHFYGGFIVAIPVRSPEGLPQVAAHLVIVESKIKLNPRIEKLNGTQFVFQNTASNTVTDDTMAGVEKLVRTHYRNKELTFISGGFTVIPVEVDLDDLSTVYRLVEYTAEAAYCRLQMYNINSVEDEGVKLAEAAAARSVSWTAHIEENPQNQTDVTGQLIRTDFSIKTTAVPAQTQNQQYQLNAVEFGEVNVFCTPVFAEPPKVPMANGVYVPMISQHYYNKIVIKDFRTGPDIRMSIGSVLMLLATTSALAINGVWKRAYIPNRHIDQSQTDIHDIGAIGYEVAILNPENLLNPQVAPRKEMINTKSAEFTSERFNMVMDAAFHPEQWYCIDVPDGHYMLGLFVAEANGNSNARNIIGKILNAMTNGKFYEWFGVEEQMFENTGERVINGYYPNRTTGQLRPIDDVDHLALLNITSGADEWIREWEHFDNAQIPQELRLARRTEIIQEFSEDHAVIKSYSTRLTVKPRFMEILSKSLLAAGLYPQLTGVASSVNTYARATSTQFDGLVLSPSQIPNVFASTGNQYNNYQGYGNNVYSGGPWGTM